MARALRLAKRGYYSTHPNPRVGCVLVRDGQCVGEGYHAQAGQAHAERQALAEAGERARGATVYVNLEPCAHHGRTPPCTEALIAAKVGRVVAAMIDPNPAVAGQGVAQLTAAGIAVDVGVLESAAQQLNRGFIQRMTRQRPWVCCKLAASLDGRTALADGSSKWISGEDSRRDVQRLRAASSAIVTGIGTVLADDPALNVRLDPHTDAPPLDDHVLRQPLRVIVDSRLRTPSAARLLHLRGQTLIATCADTTHPRAAALLAAGAELITCPDASGTQVDLTRLMTRLAEREINELLIEAGATLAGAALTAGLIDEIRLYLAPHLMGDSARGLFHLPALEQMTQRRQLTIIDWRPIGSDLRIIALPDNGMMQ